MDIAIPLDIKAGGESQFLFSGFPFLFVRWNVNP